MNFKIIANLTNMKLKLIKIFSSFIVLFSCLTYAETLDSDTQKYFEYRVNKLEDENTDLKKKIEEVEKNSRSVEQFKSVLEIHEKSMSANDRNMTNLSFLIGFISIFIPFVGYFWNRKFINETKEKLEGISKEYENKLSGYEKQMELFFSSWEQKRKDEKINIIKSSYDSTQNQNESTDNKLSIDKELFTENYNSLSINEDIEVKTNPEEIKIEESLTKVHDKLNRAKLLSEKGDIDEALRIYDDIILHKDDINSDCSKKRFYMANAYYNKGVLMAGSGEFDLAIEQYNKVIDEYKQDVDFDVKFLRVKSYINKLSLLLILNHYKEAVVGYEKFFSNYIDDDNGEMKLAIVRGCYNYMIALWKDADSGYLVKLEKFAHKINFKYRDDKNPFEIQVFLSRILNLLIFILAENNKLSESVSEFRGFVIQFSKEINPNIVLEVEKSFNDQIDLFVSLRDFGSIKEMCDIVLNNLQGNQAYYSLLERADKFKSQLDS